VDPQVAVSKPDSASPVKTNCCSERVWQVKSKGSEAWDSFATDIDPHLAFSANTQERVRERQAVGQPSDPGP